MCAASPNRRSRAALRPSLSLDGEWDFSFEGPGAHLSGEGHRIRSPGIWQAQFPALRNAQGTGRYRRRIEIPPDWASRRIILVMDGVFHESVVLVDDLPVAIHGDGWTPIEVDLTSALDSKTAFVLGVEARTPDDRHGGRFGLSLAGKQDWYGVQGGIWKPARLEARDRLHIKELAVRTSYDLAEGAVFVKGALSAPAKIRVTVSRREEALTIGELAVDAAEFEVELSIPDPDAWSPDAPNLYRVAVEAMRDGMAVDEVERTIGFRRLEARNGRLFLNGEPFFMFGALDQDWHPEEECRPPSAAFLEQRFLNAKAMGLNTLRCHVKIPDPLYFDLADRLGLIVWLDMPYAQFLAPSTREALRETFRKSVVNHGHHPAVSIWTLFNEGWGIDLDDNPDDRRWLIETFDAAKALVPDSLLVDNSPCFPRNYHLKTDIEDFHWYNGFPHQNEAFAATARAFGARAAWAWSPHGDAEKRGDEPLVCSEFGVWGLPHPSDIHEKDGSEPWWFESGHEWNAGAAYPHGIETRFRDAGLAPIFKDLDGFVDAAQELQYRALKYQIETLRWEQAISGYVITELNDVQWESNGLMDVLNRPRAFAERLADLQRPQLVVARALRTAIRVGERVQASVRLAGAVEPPHGARLAWRFAGLNGNAAIGSEPITITLDGIAVDAITIVPLELEARDRNGRLLSRNALEFCVVPPLREPAPALFPIDGAAWSALAAIGWPNCAATPDEADIVAATRLTTPVREALLAGRKVLLIANTAEALIDPQRNLPLVDQHNFPSMLLKSREGTPRDGQWMGAFSWRRTDGPWAGLPNGPMLDEHWTGLLPNYVLTGFPSTAFAGLVDAGMAVGWLHLAAAFTKRSFLGKAWMTVSTFDLTSAKAAENPLAAHLLLAIAQSSSPS
jgi:Glycosyl hydrolases family 2/Glycosyl hydrolases family 2, sugar binding domain